MQLYHTPGTCSTASRIVLQETGIAASSIPVNLREKRFRMERAIFR